MPFLFGSIGLLVLYALSIAFTRSFKPWALACGKNKDISTSLAQFLIFTAITIFCYSTVFSAWLIYNPSKPLSFPSVPVNLMILMGLSIITTSGSKGITLSYLQSGQLSQNDKSNLFSNRDGSTDLTKVQMFAWTIISAGIYLYQFVNIVNAYQTTYVIYLPDIDNTLLILMGISQGGYLTGKLVQKNTPPEIDLVVPNIVRPQAKITLMGVHLGNNEGNTILITDQCGNIAEVDKENICEWSDTRINFTLPEIQAADGGANMKCHIIVRSSGTMSKAKEFEITQV